MKLKILTMSAAAAALIASGAMAQTSTDTTQPTTPPAATTEPTTPPAASEPATPPATTATDGSMTDKTAVTDKSGPLEFTSSVGENQLLVSNVTGMAVYNSANENLGDINDVVLDESGKPTVAIIGVGGFLGMGRHGRERRWSSVRTYKVRGESGQ